jgi:hypothetical protein
MKKRLKKLLEQNSWNITEAVIKEAMDYDNPKHFFEDLLQYGCVSWMVWSLVRYTDTHKFFDEHYDEIQEIRDELQEQWIPIEIPTHTDLKNFLAWLSFEEKAREIAYDLRLEI